MVAPAPRAAASPRLQREGFALTGCSATLDPRTHAVRPDLADVRLARMIFAPHYAAPVARVLTSSTPLRAARDPGSAVLAVLDADDAFELLDIVGGDAWGIAPAAGLVGYLAADLLTEPQS